MRNEANTIPGSNKVSAKLARAAFETAPTMVAEPIRCDRVITARPGAPTLNVLASLC